jgi:uncharacterized protein YceH (UPF0502 family)
MVGNAAVYAAQDRVDKQREMRRQNARRLQHRLFVLQTELAELEQRVDRLRASRNQNHDQTE